GQLGSVHPSLEKMAAQIKHWQSKLAEGEEAKTWANRQIELKKLARLMARLDARLNPIGAFFANGLFLYDLHTINALADWKKKNGAEVEVWMQELAEREVLCSKALYARLNEGGYPE